MPVVVLIAMHDNMAGAKGHCFKRASKEMGYRRIGENLEPARPLLKSDEEKVRESWRKLYRKAKQEQMSRWNSKLSRQHWCEGLTDPTPALYRSGR